MKKLQSSEINALARTILKKSTKLVNEENISIGKVKEARKQIALDILADLNHDFNIILKEKSKEHIWIECLKDSLIFKPYIDYKVHRKYLPTIEQIKDAIILIQIEKEVNVQELEEEVIKYLKNNY